MSQLVALASATPIKFGGWEWTGNLTMLDLVAAATNALNGALLARRPDHYKRFTFVGIMLMAILAGLGGGITRDVLLNDVPSALTNPAYIVLAVAAGLVGYKLAYAKGQLFREGLFQFSLALSLPWYAIVGAQKAAETGLPVVGILLIAVVGATAGRYYVDLSSGVPPKQFIRGEWFVGTAVLTACVWIACDVAGLSTWPASLIAFAAGFLFRITALFLGWEEPLAKEPKGVVMHGSGRPLLGRKLEGKSKRELADLGLTVDAAD